MTALAIMFLPAIAIAAEPLSSRQLICQTIEEAAVANGLPAGFLARLLWTESGFRSAATSLAGAEGVAQFMPQTAAERGLADPRDAHEAIYHAARLLIDLHRQFGNLGLAAAAYNAGAARVGKWLQGQSKLPMETQIYVRALTGRPVEYWAASRSNLVSAADSYELAGHDCLNFGAGQRTSAGRAPKVRVWPLGLDSQPVALSFLNPPGSAKPLRSRPWAMRAAAASLCEKIRARGANCQVFEH